MGRKTKGHDHVSDGPDVSDVSQPRPDGDHKDDEHGHPPLPPGVLASPEDTTPGYYFRAGQVITAKENLDLVLKLLGSIGQTPARKATPLPGDQVLLEIPALDDLPGVIDDVQRLARLSGEIPTPLVSPNHVLFGMSHPTPLPGGPPRPTDAPALEALPYGDDLPGGRITVAVLDSGVAADHPWLPARVVLRRDEDVEEAADGTLLPPFAGHGTHIAGVIRRHAPGARILVRKVFEPSGEIDDARLAKELNALPREVDIVCLSLGGAAQGDLTLPATAAVLREWSVHPVLRRRVVVAAAGNDGSQRPMWPAAFKRVVGVAALDPVGNRAPFSNSGPWVDACSAGVNIDSSFFTFEGPLQPASFFGSPARARPDVASFKGFARWDGTSFAAPRVAAAIACAMSIGLDGPEAVYRLIGAPGVERKPDLGAVVQPPSFLP